MLEPVFCAHDEYLEVNGDVAVRRCRRCPAETSAWNLYPAPLPPWIIGERAGGQGGDDEGGQE